MRGFLWSLHGSCRAAFVTPHRLLFAWVLLGRQTGITFPDCIPRLLPPSLRKHACTASPVHVPNRALLFFFFSISAVSPRTCLSLSPFWRFLRCVDYLRTRSTVHRASPAPFAFPSRLSATGLLSFSFAFQLPVLRLHRTVLASACARVLPFGEAQIPLLPPPRCPFNSVSPFLLHSCPLPPSLVPPRYTPDFFFSIPPAGRAQQP